MKFLSKKTGRLDTVIGVNTVFRGETEVSGAIRIDGKFYGNIKSDNVMIGMTGRFEGEIFASSVLVSGVIIGKIYSTEFVEIKPKGRVTGDIQTERLIIEAGGIFDGRSIVTMDINPSEMITNNSPLEIQNESKVK